jgi:hypothetical protein
MDPKIQDEIDHWRRQCLPVSSMHMPVPCDREGNACHTVSRDRNRFRETWNLNEDQLVIQNYDGSGCHACHARDRLYTA